MPNYNIRLGNQRFRLASTDKPVSQAIGKHLAGVTPETKVDSRGGHHSYSFDGQEIDFEDLRDIKDIRDSGGQIAQLVKYKALLNFGEGAEFHVEDEQQDHTQLVDGEELSLTEWLEQEAFPHVDLLVLDLGEDALWYPAAYGELRENQVGDFAEFLPSEPWTILPETNPHGEVISYHQRVQQNGGYLEQTLAPEDIVSIILNKQSARDKTGISEVLRNKDEIQAFKENEQAINQAIELHGFPQRHVKVGREDGAPIRDDDLRRVRTIFDPKTSDANTAYFTGQDVDVDTLEAHQFDYSAIHEMDMRNLTTALGLPLEAGNVGSDGLGSGKPAELRFALLKLAIKANQRSFSTQFISKIVRPVLRDYSPFDHTAPVSMEIDDPLEDIGEMADVINTVGEYMTNEQAAHKLDLPKPDDDEIAGSYRSPADIERFEEEGETSGGGPLDDAGGLFRENSEGGEGNDYLTTAPEWDKPLLEMHAKVTDPNTDPSRTLVSYAESATPEFVLERIREAIMSGAMFSEFDEIPSDRLMQLREEMADSLTTNFTLDSITENLMEFEADLDRQEAERIARTESSAVLNKAREVGYEEKGQDDGLFYWTGASPGSPRQTDACEWLIEQTNPNYGGTPVPMSELKELIDEAPTHDDDMENDLARPESFVVHPNERSTFVMAPGSS